MSKMITDDDEKVVQSIIEFIKKHEITWDSSVDWEKVKWVDTLSRMINNLKIAPESYKMCSAEDMLESFYTSKCGECGWYGSSKLLDGGSQIADTGDYSESTCPVCGNSEIEEIDFTN